MFPRLQIYFFVFKKYNKLFSYGYKVVCGRNFFGRLTVQHKGGGVKTNYRRLDFHRSINQYGFVLRVCKDSYRSGFVGFVFYDSGLSNFILLSEGLIKGSKFFSGPQKVILDNKVGSTQKLLNINLFDHINSVEFFPLSGFRLLRSAGSSSKIISKDNKKSVLKLNSGWQISLPNHSMAVFGVVSNLSFNYKAIGKAGNNRIKGIRPSVRGVIKNPCDHPHGGGEGRGSPPVAQVSP
jgi:large subunit ribosomal protein L2